MSRKFWVLPATACAVVLVGTPLTGSAYARKLPRIPAVLARLRATASPRPAPDRVHVGAPRTAAAPSRPRIIGGYGAVQGDWGFMAFILHVDANGNPDFMCDGTVVAPNVVLTAGHCAVDETTGATLDASGFGVVTGTLDWTNAAQRQLSLVSQVIVNPAYDPAIAETTDAALLVLSTPTTAPAIPLATSADAYLEQAGTPAYVAGWGDVYSGGGDVAPLQWAPTVVQRPGYCALVDPYFDGSAELCTVNPPTDDTGTCNGDSGGPLAAFGPSGELVEIGVTSFGPADCNTSTADYFTSVIPIYSWAAGWIHAVAPPPPPPPPAPPPAPSPPSPVAPPPSQASPPATLPTMTLSDAKSYVRQTLAGALSWRFKPPHGYTARCRRTSSTRFTCGIQFWHGPNDYYGSVTVYYVPSTLDGGGVGWRDNYTLHWVNDQCYFHSGHPQTCAVHTRRGSW